MKSIRALIAVSLILGVEVVGQAVRNGWLLAHSDGDVRF
jgi:Flp pilus assembly pilin Flp